MAGDFSSDPAADKVAHRALAASAALHDELAAALRRRLKRLPAHAPTSDVLDAARHTLAEFAGPLASLLADATLAAWLVGAGGVAALMPAAPGTPKPPRPPFSLPPADEPPDFDWDGSPAWLPLVRRAVEELRSRELLTPERYRTASAEVRARSFTVAGVESEKALAAVREAVAETIQDGSGLGDFRRRVAAAIGESALGPAHAENIFRTTAGRAYADAREAMGQEPVVREAFPYRFRVITNDSRITDLCATLARSGIDGTAIYRAADPVWQHFRPLSHWQCRCGSILLTREQAAGRGLVSARRWLETGDDPRDFVEWPDVELPRGWVPGGPVKAL